MDFKDLVQKRRSIRQFTDEPLLPADVQTILRAGLMSPTSKCSRAWQFIVVENKDTLEKLSQCKLSGAQFVSNAPLAVVVMADTEKSEAPIEDASIAAVTMQYQAADLGLGSCWAQIRGRFAEDGTPSEEIVRQLLHCDDHLLPVAIIALGHPAITRKPQDEEKLLWENVKVQE